MTRNGHDNERPDERKLSAEEQAALQALRQLPRPVAPPEARRMARDAFLHGKDPANPAPAPRPERRSLSLLLTLTTAFAAILVAIGVYGTRPAYDWYVTDVVEASGVQADAPSIEKGIRLTAGTITTTGDSQVEIQLGDQLRFRMLPGTKIQLPESPGRWFNRSRTIDLLAGEIYGTTGGKPLDFDLRVHTAEANAHIMGTTFAVLRFDFGTCVCLWTGELMVEPMSGDEGIMMPDEMKYFVYNDGRPNEMMPIDDMERMKLSMTQDAGLMPEDELPE